MLTQLMDESHRNAQVLRTRNGQSSIEFVCGLAVLIPIMLIAIDLCVVYVGVSFNDRVCREATRAAANGPPNALSSGSPRSRAQAAIETANKNATFQVDPNCSVLETITSLPKPNLGGAVDGSITVETTITVHPPLLLRGFFEKRGLRFSTRATCPITYIAVSTQRRIQSAPAGDSWQVTIAADRMDGYLAHGGSLIPNIARLSVFCMNVENHGSATSYSAPVHYEDLFYTERCAIGCNRFHALEAKPNATGIIRVGKTSGAATSVDGYGAGNAVGRLFLDLLQKRCIVRQVVVPLSAFKEVIQGMCLSGFHEEKDQDPLVPVRAIIQVVSDPEGAKEPILY